MYEHVYIVILVYVILDLVCLANLNRTIPIKAFTIDVLINVFRLFDLFIYLLSFI